MHGYEMHPLLMIKTLPRKKFNKQISGKGKTEEAQVPLVIIHTNYARLQKGN